MNAGIVHSLFNQLYFRDSLSTLACPLAARSHMCAIKIGRHSHTAISTGAGCMPRSLAAATQKVPDKVHCNAAL